MDGLSRTQTDPVHSWSFIKIYYCTTLKLKYRTLLQYERILFRYVLSYSQKLIQLDQYQHVILCIITKPRPGAEQPCSVFPLISDSVPHHADQFVSPPLSKVHTRTHIQIHTHTEAASSGLLQQDRLLLSSQLLWSSDSSPWRRHPKQQNRQPDGKKTDGWLCPNIHRGESLW